MNSKQFLRVLPLAELTGASDRIMLVIDSLNKQMDGK